jgi:citrate lyase subunit beta/citryl-CoA lyase
MAELNRVGSMRFMPASRAGMIAKIPRLAPDVAVVDLEDAVPADAKDAARDIAAAAIGALDPAGPATVLIRVNPVGTPWFADDVAMAADCAAAGLVVPKLESQHQLDQVRQVMAEHARLDALLVVGLETALGVADARILLARGVSGAYFGAEDFIADIGGRRTSGSEEVLYARSQVCLAARLAGIPAVDQVALAHRVFTPTEAEFAHARQVLAAGEAGVGVVDGQMIDDVHVRMARATLARAAPPQSTEPDPP